MHKEDRIFGQLSFKLIDIQTHTSTSLDTFHSCSLKYIQNTFSLFKREFFQYFSELELLESNITPPPPRNDHLTFKMKDNETFSPARSQRSEYSYKIGNSEFSSFSLIFYIRVQFISYENFFHWTSSFYNYFGHARPYCFFNRSSTS